MHHLRHRCREISQVSKLVQDSWKLELYSRLNGDPTARYRNDREGGWGKSRIVLYHA